ncbi:hypothetical protein P9686_15855, partial [Weizmannia sp. CD-2023]|nr:hypothetical protein [Weizmannia sp. CD-2023]
FFTNFYGKEYHLQKISYTTQQILHKKMAFFSGHGRLKKTKESQLDNRGETASNMNFNFPLVMSPDKV